MRSHRLLFAAAVLVPGLPALAYNELTHEALTSKAFAARPAWTSAQLVPPAPEELAAFRALLWRALAAVPDEGLRTAFLQRFPTEASCDAWALKEFLMLNPAATVHGLDAVGNEQEPLARGALLQRASRWPDDDRRNRSRFFYDGQRRPVLDPAGNPLPFDPMTLNLGSLTGTSSQAHAHYALRDQPLSDDPRVLMKDPAGFAMPKETQAYGGELAQLYTDLALLASGSGLSGGPWLEATFAGAAFHHVQDTANQIHTLQVGPFVFFQAAIGQLVLRDLVTQGGLFGERATLVKLGTRIISNHHLLLEDLFAKRFAELLAGKPASPELAAAVQGLDTDDAVFAGEARRKMAETPDRFAHMLVKALVARGGVEGPEVYRLIWELSVPTLHDGRGHEYDGDQGDDPDKFVELRGKDDEARLKTFYALEGAGLRRATTAQRLWLAAFEVEQQRPDVRARAATRILATLVPYHAAAEARRKAYMPPAPAGQQPVAWGYPLATLAGLALVAWLVRRRVAKARALLG